MGSGTSKTYPENTVVLHQFPRALHAPSFSSFSLKLETWLRMAKIPYENEFGYKFSEHSLMPWIELNGESMPDSQIIIEFLSKKFNVDLNRHLSDEQKGISRAVLKLTEESLRWVGLIHRIVLSKDNDAGMNKLLVSLILRPRTKKRANGQGYGRFSKEQLYDIGRRDMKAIEDIIGNKKFLFGDQVCDTDAALFGLLCQAIFQSKGPLHDYIMESCPNIRRHTKNMKETFWPDWDKNVKEPVNFV